MEKMQGMTEKSGRKAEQLREKNLDLVIYETKDPEFAEYGCRIEGQDVSALIREALKTELPLQGSAYSPSLVCLEEAPGNEKLQKYCYGELPAQTGYCYGHNSLLNAWEWHAASEINIAVTDLILILATKKDLVDGKTDSGKAKAFYIKKGEMVEIYSSTLHFCPCEVSKEGFGCIVILPKGTNLPLEEEEADPLLFRKNKWLIAHEENKDLIQKGVTPGITGTNIRINY